MLFLYIYLREIYCMYQYIVLIYQVRCFQIGGYLVNFEILEEIMLMKDILFKMKIGNVKGYVKLILNVVKR